MPTEDVAYQQRLKIRRTTLGFGVIQVILGLALTGLSFTAFVLSEAEKIRNACPYWAGFTVFCSGGVGIVAWRHSSVLSMGLFTFFSAVCVVLHMIGTILTGEVGGLLKSIMLCHQNPVTQSCMCCDSIMTCKQNVPTFKFEGVEDCSILTGLLKELLYGLCVLNIFGSLVCFIATILGCTSVARQAGRDQPLFRRQFSAPSDSHEQSQYSWLHYPTDLNVLPPYAPPIYRSVDNFQDCGAAPYIVPPPVFDPTDLPPPYSSRNASLSSSGFSLYVQNEEQCRPGRNETEHNSRGGEGSSSIVITEVVSNVCDNQFQQRIYSENRSRPGNPVRITNALLTRNSVCCTSCHSDRTGDQSLNSSQVSLQSEARRPIEIIGQQIEGIAQCFETHILQRYEEAEECKEIEDPLEKLNTSIQDQNMTLQNDKSKFKSKRHTNRNRRQLGNVDQLTEIIRFEQSHNLSNMNSANKINITNNKLIPEGIINTDSADMQEFDTSSLIEKPNLNCDSGLQDKPINQSMNLQKDSQEADLKDTDGDIRYMEGEHHLEQRDQSLCNLKSVLIDTDVVDVASDTCKDGNPTGSTEASVVVLDDNAGYITRTSELSADTFRDCFSDQYGTRYFDSLDPDFEGYQRNGLGIFSNRLDHRTLLFGNEECGNDEALPHMVLPQEILNSWEKYSESDSQILSDGLQDHLIASDTSHHQLISTNTSHHQLTPSDASHPQLTPSDASHPQLISIDANHLLSPSDASHHQLISIDASHHQLTPSDASHPQLISSVASHHQLIPSDASHHQLIPGDASHQQLEIDNKNMIDNCMTAKEANITGLLLSIDDSCNFSTLVSEVSGRCVQQNDDGTSFMDCTMLENASSAECQKGYYSDVEFTLKSFGRKPRFDKNWENETFFGGTTCIESGGSIPSMTQNFKSDYTEVIQIMDKVNSPRNIHPTCFVDNTIHSGNNDGLPVDLLDTKLEDWEQMRTYLKQQRSGSGEKTLQDSKKLEYSMSSGQSSGDFSTEDHQDQDKIECKSLTTKVSATLSDNGSEINEKISVNKKPLAQSDSCIAKEKKFHASQKKIRTCSDPEVTGLGISGMDVCRHRKSRNRGRLLNDNCVGIPPPNIELPVEIRNQGLGYCLNESKVQNRNIVNEEYRPKRKASSGNQALKNKSSSCHHSKSTQSSKEDFLRKEKALKKTIKLRNEISRSFLQLYKDQRMIPGGKDRENLWSPTSERKRGLVHGMGGHPHACGLISGADLMKKDSPNKHHGKELVMAGNRAGKETFV